MNEILSRLIDICDQSPGGIPTWPPVNWKKRARLWSIPSRNIRASVRSKLHRRLRVMDITALIWNQLILPGEG